MTDAFFGLVSSYGAAILFVSCYLSCLFIPIPSSLLMLAGGAFVASGDLVLWQVVTGAYLGAVLGDQTGFRLGRFGDDVLIRLTRGRPARERVLDRARKMVARRGGPGVFFSTWLVAPLGPWVNLIAGATGLGWVRFTLWDAAGEAIWVTVYVALGYAFAGQITFVGDVLSNAVASLAALIVAGGLAWTLRDALRHHRHRDRT